MGAEKEGEEREKGGRKKELDMKKFSCPLSLQRLYLYRHNTVHNYDRSDTPPIDLHCTCKQIRTIQ